MYVYRCGLKCRPRAAKRLLRMAMRRPRVRERSGAAGSNPTGIKAWMVVFVFRLGFLSILRHDVGLVRLPNDVHENSTPCGLWRI